VERRVAPLAALLVVLSLGGVAFAASSASQPGPLAAVTWPVSTLLVSEVQTGGASASDEFAEITNVGPTAIDLAGLELVYAPDDRWEFAEGVTYRSYRFRLAPDNATPSGVGENSFIPLFLRVTRKLAKDARLDFYGAISTGGKIKVDTESGGGLYSDNYKIGPALGATLVVDF